MEVDIVFRVIQKAEQRLQLRGILMRKNKGKRGGNQAKKTPPRQEHKKWQVLT
jgi:hypothetical protein